MHQTTLPLNCSLRIKLFTHADACDWIACLIGAKQRRSSPSQLSHAAKRQTPPATRRLPAGPQVAEINSLRSITLTQSLQRGHFSQTASRQPAKPANDITVGQLSTSLQRCAAALNDRSCILDKVVDQHRPGTYTNIRTVFITCQHLQLPTTES